MNEIISIYLDESGDLGFNFANKGTPRYFSIGLLVCKNKYAVDEFKKAVRKTLKHKVSPKTAGSLELKGTDTTLSAKKYFYNQVESSKDWHVYGVVLDKHKLKSKTKSLPHENIIYNCLSMEILAHVNLADTTGNILLVADKKKNKHEASEFNKYISNQLISMIPSGISCDISHQDSHQNPMLQSVDLFCWGMQKYYEHQDNSWLSIFESRLTLIESNYSGAEKRRSLQGVTLAF